MPIAILDLHRPLDGSGDRAATSGIAPAARVEAVEKKTNAVPLADMQQVAVPPKLAGANDEVLRLAEEQRNSRDNGSCGDPTALRFPAA